MNMLDNAVMTSRDRQALRDYYYQVKACTTWCVKIGQSAIRLTPEYLSRATVRLSIKISMKRIFFCHLIGTLTSESSGTNILMVILRELP